MGVKTASDGWFGFPLEIMRELGPWLSYQNNPYLFHLGELT
jgi:hypothetical protein